jgi:hypothetical protein
VPSDEGGEAEEFLDVFVEGREEVEYHVSDGGGHSWFRCCGVREPTVFGQQARELADEERVSVCSGEDAANCARGWFVPGFASDEFCHFGEAEWA